MSLVKQLHDYNKERGLYPRSPYSYSWSFGMAWESVAVALVDVIVSKIDLFMSPERD